MSQLLEVVESMGDYKSIHADAIPADWDVRRDTAQSLVENRNGLAPHRWEYELREVMTTDDFPLLFADSIERDLIARYKIAEPELMKVVKRGSVKDFKQVKRFRMDGGTCRLPQVQEKGEYTAAKLDETRYYYFLNKWGRQFDFSWETLINDDLGAFNDVAQRMADSCINTRNWFITDLFWNAGGPSAAAFGNTPANTALSIGALETAVEAMSVYRDPTCNEPIYNRPKYLMVDPAIEMTARQILTSSHKMWVESAGGAATAYPTSNVIAQYELELIVNPWIPFIDTTSNPPSWALFADPNAVRTAEVGFLKGHENPELYMKSSNQVKVGGGGLTSAFDGDFATDNVMYKVRHVFGGAVMDTRGNWAAGAVTP